MISILPIILFVLHQFALTNAFATCNAEPWIDTECILITDCEEHSNYIKQLHSTNSIRHHEYMTGHLRRITCGYEEYVPKVCCPVHHDNIKTERRMGALDSLENNSSTVENNSSINCGTFIWSKRLNSDDHPTDLGEFSWIALLEYNTTTGTKFGCGGVLISDRYVLTAAHCVAPYLNLTGVRLGEHDLNRDPDCVYEGSDVLSRYCSDNFAFVGVEKLIPHENYSFVRDANNSAPRSHDIALLRLNRTISSDLAKSICLPGETTVMKGKYLSAGWGAELENDYPRSSVKRMSRLTGVKDEVCEETYGKAVGNDTLCAKSKSLQTACIGDSGGPLMSIDVESRMTVEGIFSPISSEFCLIGGVPGTYTDVRKYMDWIKANM